MRSSRPALAGTAALAAAAGFIPASMLGPAASASMPAHPAVTSRNPLVTNPLCAGTSLVRDTKGTNIRVPTTANGSGNITCSLEEGDVNIAVSRLQIALDHCSNAHLSHLTVDGHYGSHTKANVSFLQAQQQISVDGRYGPVTAHHIAWPIAGTFSHSCSFI